MKKENDNTEDLINSYLKHKKLEVEVLHKIVQFLESNQLKNIEFVEESKKLQNIIINNNKKEEAENPKK